MATRTESRSFAPCGSLTVSRNVSSVSAATSGAVNVAVAVSAFERSTVGFPARCFHAKPSSSPSGSVPRPASVTASPAPTAWFAPALALGLSLSAFTVTVAVSGAESAVPSLTVRLKSSVYVEARLGAANVGFDADALDSATPAGAVHA